MANFIELDFEENFGQILKGSKGRLVYSLFFASWSEPAVEALRDFQSLAEEHPSVLFLAVDADKYEGICTQYGMESVPAVVFVNEREPKLQHLADLGSLRSLLLKELEAVKTVEEPTPVQVTPKVKEGACNHDADEHSHSHSHSGPHSHSHSHSDSHAHSHSHSHAHDGEAPQWSTVVSDGVLAAICLVQGKKLLEANHLWAAIAFAIVGAAASCGTLRFGGVSWIKPLHSWLSAAGAAVSLPLIGWNITQPVMPTDTTSLIVPPLLLIGGFVARTALRIKPYDTVIAAVGLGAILITGMVARDPNALLGGVSVALFSLGIGTEGFLFGLRRVDIFHYGFAFALSALAKSLLLSSSSL